MKKILSLFVMLMLLPMLSLAGEYKILASVSNQSITSIDVEKRIKINKYYNKLVSGQEPVNHEDVLESLINEKAVYNYAIQEKIKVEDDEYNRMIENIKKAAGLKQSIESHSSKNGIKYADLQELLKHKLLWSKIVTYKIRSNIAVTEEELENEAKKFISIENKIDLLQVVIDAVEYNRNKRQFDTDIAKLTSSDCKSATDYIGKYVVSSQMINAIKIADLNPAIAQAVANLPVAKFSPVLDSGESLNLFAKCKIYPNNKQLSSEEKMQLREMIIARKSNIEAMRLLAEIKAARSLIQYK